MNATVYLSTNVLGGSQDEFLRFVAEHGIRQIELNDQYSHERWNGTAALIEAALKEGLEIPIVAAILSWSDIVGDINSAALESSLKAFEMGKAQRLNVYVIPRNIPPDASAETFTEFLEGLRHRTKDLVPVIGIENVASPAAPPFLNDPMAMKLLVQQIGIRSIRLTLDLANALLSGFPLTRELLFDLSPYVGHVHLKNFSTVRPEDLSARRTWQSYDGTMVCAGPLVGGCFPILPLFFELQEIAGVPLPLTLEAIESPSILRASLGAVRCANTVADE